MGGVVGGLAGGLVNSAIGSAGLNQAGVNGPVSPELMNQINAQQQAAQKQQQDFVNALMGVNGIQNQQNVFNQLQDVASGQGPNPAQAMLNQATGANVANQAALLASARGASANPALIARQAAMAGTNAQQQAAGQAANLQANQSLGALNQLGGLAGQQVAQQQQGLQALNQGALNAQGNALGATGQANQLNASIEGGNKQTQRNMFGQVLGAAGSGLQMLGGGGAKAAGAEGGMVQPASEYAKMMMAGGGMAKLAGTIGGAMLGGPMGAQIGSQIGSQIDGGGGGASSGPQPLDPGVAGLQLQPIGVASTGMLAGQKPSSDFGKLLNEMFTGAPKVQDPGGAGAQANGMMANFAAAEGGEVPALVSPGERYLPPHEVKKVAKGEKPAIKAGEKIPGKPMYPGNDYRNDVVPKKLEEGGIVLPNSVMQSKDPAKEAHKFVSAILAKQGKALPKNPKKD